MKKFFICLGVLCVFCVSACGGGGSGDSAQIIKDHDSIFTAIPTRSSTGLSHGSLTKTADGLQLNLVDQFRLASQATARIVDLPSGENSVYRDYGTEIRASVDSQFTLTNEPVTLVSTSDNFTGNVLITDILRLGGMKAGLKYSEFGLWLIDVAFNGTVGGTPANLNIPLVGSSFAFGDGAMARNFTANSGEQRFSGLALANVWDSSDPSNRLVADLHGTATLTVDTANLATGGSLELSFADFYNFQMNGLDATGLGFFKPGTPVITPNGTNTTGIVFSPNELDGYADGFFYGATMPEEAVGKFSFTDGVGKGIIGAFGVVQQP